MICCRRKIQIFMRITVEIGEIRACCQGNTQNFPPLIILMRKALVPLQYKKYDNTNGKYFTHNPNYISNTAILFPLGIYCAYLQAHACALRGCSRGQMQTSGPQIDGTAKKSSLRTHSLLSVVEGTHKALVYSSIIVNFVFFFRQAWMSWRKLWSASDQDHMDGIA